MKYITLDTGYKGGMVLWLGGQPLAGFAFKQIGTGINIDDVHLKLREWKPEKIYIEIFPPMPMQGVKSTSAQWRVIGQLETLCQLYADVVEYIYVATWTSFTKRLSVNPNQQNKKISQELTRKYFSEFAAPWKKTKLFHDGIADCLALGIYVNRDEYINDLE